ncbi:hypothetical protein ABBQ38_003475 [Trebouxia sp. C0009 RCD-2024]
MSAKPIHSAGVPQGTSAGLGGNVAALWGSAGVVDVALPTDKLLISRVHDVDHRPVVLVNCGSFNPPTIMHLRMFDVAAQVLRKAGRDVLGGYMSPVNDAYHKPGLLPAHHRIAMCQRAVAESDIAMVDTWEAAQPDAQRSLVVLDRVQQAVQRHYDNATAAGPDQHQCDQQANGKAKHSSDHRLDERPQTAETPCNNLAALGNVQQQHPKSQMFWSHSSSQGCGLKSK